MADLKAKESRGSLSEIKLSIDVSEALTGLKAIQREARAATKAIRELESVSLESEYGMREGSVIHTLSKAYGLTPLDIDKLTHKERAFLLAGISTKDLTDELSKRPNVMYRKRSDLIEPIPKGFTLVVVDD